MLFNSYVFLCVFLPAMLVGWWFLCRTSRQRLLLLTLMSYAFYAYFDFPTGLLLLPLLIVSTSVDYAAGRLLHDMVGQDRRRQVLIGALSFNLALLAVFKYLGFFAGTMNALAGLVGAPGLMPVLHLALPIGISFYTFNSMSYTIDMYRRRVEPATNYLEYAAFVALFPHLIAGPIVRFSEIGPQLRNLHTRLNSRMAAVGLFFLVCGLFKKLVIADQIAPTVDRLFASADHLTVISGWAAAIGYSLQLYFDFSAYSDMAVGLAMLLGLRFPQNFDSPYKATSIADFWRRWHMSLSSWLRDYVYIPFGGSRLGRLLTLRNLFLTMLIGGLWHGAAWVFVAWGMGHGLALVLHSLWRSSGLSKHLTTLTGASVQARMIASRALTFACIAVLWVPFRAGSTTQFASVGTAVDQGGQHAFHTAGAVLSGMFGAHGLGLSDLRWATATDAVGASVPLVFVALLVALMWFVNVAPNTWQVRLQPSRRMSIALAGMATWSILVLATPSPFLYFQF